MSGWDTGTYQVLCSNEKNDPSQTNIARSPFNQSVYENS